MPHLHNLPGPFGGFAGITAAEGNETERKAQEEVGTRASTKRHSCSGSRFTPFLHSKHLNSSSLLSSIEFLSIYSYFENEKKQVPSITWENGAASITRRGNTLDCAIRVGTQNPAAICTRAAIQRVIVGEAAALPDRPFHSGAGAHIVQCGHHLTRLFVSDGLRKPPQFSF